MQVGARKCMWISSSSSRPRDSNLTARYARFANPVMATKGLSLAVSQWLCRARQGSARQLLPSGTPPLTHVLGAALLLGSSYSLIIHRLPAAFAAGAALYHVREVKPHIFVWVPDDVLDQDGDPQFSRAGTAGFITRADAVIVVNATNSPTHARELLYEIRQRTDLPIKYVIDTDSDGEHTLGNEVFVDEQAVIISTGGVQAAMRRYRDNLLQRLRGDWRLQSRMRGFHPTPPGETFEGDRVLRPQVREDRTGSEAAVAQAGKSGAASIPEGEIKLIQLAGSVPSSTASIPVAARQATDSKPEAVPIANFRPTGDVAVYLPAAKVLFLGDRFQNAYYPRFGMGSQSRDIRGWIEGLRQLETWDVDVYVPGHGDPGGKTELATFRQFLEWLRNEVDTRIKEGKSLGQIEQELRTPLENYHWHAPELASGGVEAVYSQLTPQHPAPAAAPEAKF